MANNPSSELGAGPERKLNSELGAGPERKLNSDHDKDGIDRRGFLKCMAWAGTGVLCAMTGGVLRSLSLSDIAYGADAPHIDSITRRADFLFVQISDSHIGFSKAPNKDVVGTFQTALNRIHQLGRTPDFLIHTGDLTHMSASDEFDTVQQMLKGSHFNDVFYVPGEHDVNVDNGKAYLERFGKGTHGSGWYSLNHRGVHFVGLNNVHELKAKGLGYLGDEQILWLKKDLESQSSSTPIVIFAHIPLWTVYQDWGWGTNDSQQVLQILRRFGSVTVLNGHIHQTLQKTEGNIVFHTAMSTAFPQPQPGKAAKPGPYPVAAGELGNLLGITNVSVRNGDHPLAIVDTPLGAIK